MSINCGKCKKKVGDKEEGVSCELCKDWYHAPCIGYSTAQYKLLKSPNLLWFCDVHKDKVNDMMATLSHEIHQNLKELKESISSLTAVVKKQQERSYADTVKMSIASNVHLTKSQPSTNSGIIVASTQQNCSSLTIEKTIKEKVDLVQAKTGVTLIKHISNDRIFLATQTESDSKSLEKIVSEKMGPEFRVSQPKKILPQLIISNVEKEYEEENLNEEIRSTNAGFDEQDRVKIVYSRSFKRGDKTKWNLILQAPPRTFDKLINSYINVNFRAHYVKEYVTVMRCFNCQQYGHKGSTCCSSTVCSRCSGPHKTSECQKKTQFSCINCMEHNKKNELKVNTNHTCGGKDCNVEKSKIANKRTKISYECQPTW